MSLILTTHETILLIITAILLVIVSLGRKYFEKINIFPPDTFIAGVLFIVLKKYVFTEAYSTDFLATFLILFSIVFPFLKIFYIDLPEIALVTSVFRAYEYLTKNVNLNFLSVFDNNILLIFVIVGIMMLLVYNAIKPQWRGKSFYRDE